MHMHHLVYGGDDFNQRRPENWCEYAVSMMVHDRDCLSLRHMEAYTLYTIYYEHIESFEMENVSNPRFLLFIHL